MKINEQKTTYIFCHLVSQWRKAGSGCHWYGSAAPDPDTYQNVTDPQHQNCESGSVYGSGSSILGESGYGSGYRGLMTKNHSDKPAAEFQPNMPKDNVLLCSFSLMAEFWLNNKILGMTSRKSFAGVCNSAKCPPFLGTRQKWLKFCEPFHPQIDHKTISSSPLLPGFRIRTVLMRIWIQFSSVN